MSSTSKCPLRYCRSNSLFSPTYDEIIRLICLVCRRSPRPKSSTPALLLTTVRPSTFVDKRPLISFSGMPHSPKPWEWNLWLQCPANGYQQLWLMAKNNPPLMAITYIVSNQCMYIILMIMYYTSDQELGSFGNVLHSRIGIIVKLWWESRSRCREARNQDLKSKTTFTNMETQCSKS